MAFTSALSIGVGRRPGVLQIVSAQADLMGVNQRTGQPRVLRSVSSRDGFESALVGLSDAMRGEPFGNELRLNHVDIRVHFDVPGSRPAKVTVKVKPPASAIFKRPRFEHRIMTLLPVDDNEADAIAILLGALETKGGPCGEGRGNAAAGSARGRQRRRTYGDPAASMAAVAAPWSI
jgi:hypothetical protein